MFLTSDFLLYFQSNYGFLISNLCSDLQCRKLDLWRCSLTKKTAFKSSKLWIFQPPPILFRVNLFNWNRCHSIIIIELFNLVHYMPLAFLEDHSPTPYDRRWGETVDFYQIWKVTLPLPMSNLWVGTHFVLLVFLMMMRNTIIIKGVYDIRRAKAHFHNAYPYGFLFNDCQPNAPFNTCAEKYSMYCDNKHNWLLLGAVVHESQAPARATVGWCASTAWYNAVSAAEALWATIYTWPDLLCQSSELGSVREVIWLMTQLTIVLRVYPYDLIRFLYPSLLLTYEDLPSQALLWVTALLKRYIETLTQTV